MKRIFARYVVVLSLGILFFSGMPDTALLESISHKIHKQGIAVGIMTNVTIDHATPAAFYAHSLSRDDYHDIAMQLPMSSFAFFGSGEFVKPNGTKNVYDALAEGGKIDWAAHANDVKSDRLEVLDLADAVEVAYHFYLKHPDQTLIVVTADHETGGLTMGYKGGYSLNFNELSTQRKSLDKDKSQLITIKKRAQKAKLGWTTRSHTGATVPVFAMGTGSGLFPGRMDNTEIPKKICEAMGVTY